jgi:hypothetical protein
MKKERQHIILAILLTFVVTAGIGSLWHRAIVDEIDEGFQFQWDECRAENSKLIEMVNENLGL